MRSSNDVQTHARPHAHHAVHRRQRVLSVLTTLITSALWKVVVGLVITLDIIVLMTIVDFERSAIADQKEEREQAGQLSGGNYANVSGLEAVDILCMLFFWLEQLIVLILMGPKRWLRPPRHETRGYGNAKRDINMVIGDQRARFLLCVCHTLGVIHWAGRGTFGSDNRIFDLLRLLGLLRFKRLFGLLGRRISVFHSLHQ
jgi:hypothetical protein